VEDQRGKRFGIPDFTMTAGLWLRAILREVHGIQPGPGLRLDLTTFHVNS